MANDIINTSGVYWNYQFPYLGTYHKRTQNELFTSYLESPKTLNWWVQQSGGNILSFLSFHKKLDLESQSSKSPTI